MTGWLKGEGEPVRGKGVVRLEAENGPQVKVLSREMTRSRTTKPQDRWFDWPTDRARRPVARVGRGVETPQRRVGLSSNNRCSGRTGENEPRYSEC